MRVPETIPPPPALDEQFRATRYRSRAQAIVDEAKRRIVDYCPEWTDHNVSDPGIALIELFAWMYDGLLFRTDRLPEDVLAEFLRLVGMPLAPPEPARTQLYFALTRPGLRENVVVPANTEVSTPRSDAHPPIIFTVDRELVIHPAEVREIQLYNYSQRSGGGRSISVPMDPAIPQSTQIVANLFPQETAQGDGIPMFPMGRESRQDGTHESRPELGDRFCIGFYHDLSDHVIELTFTCVEGAAANFVEADNRAFRWGATRTRPDTGSPLPEAGQFIEPEYHNPRGGFTRHTQEIVRLRLPRIISPADTRDTPGPRYWVYIELNLNHVSEGQRRLHFTTSPRLKGLTVRTLGANVSSSHHRIIENEQLGVSDGRPGQRFFLSHTPVIPLRPPDEQLVSEELPSRSHQEAREVRVWESKPDFSESYHNNAHYRLDLRTGEVAFGPNLPLPDGSVYQFGLAPDSGHRLVMRRYRSGGGSIGNVPANALTVIPDLIREVQGVTNPEAATGGRDAQTLANARHFIPLHLRTRTRAVTKEDYEVIACEHPPILRAYCHTPTQARPRDPNNNQEFLHPGMWDRYQMRPGQVRVFILPTGRDVQGPAGPRADEFDPQGNVLYETGELLRHASLVGSTVEVTSAHDVFERVTVTARLRLRFKRGGSQSEQQIRRATEEEVERAVLNVLYGYLNPVTGGTYGRGWEFGDAVDVGQIRFRIEQCRPREIAYIEQLTVELRPVDWEREHPRTLLEGQSAVARQGNENGGQRTFALLPYQLVVSGAHSITFGEPVLL